MIMKLIAFENQYFWFAWNLFDMFIVIAADIGIILDRSKTHLKKNIM